MRILSIFFNPEIRTGGHRRYLELVVGLAKRGNEVVCIKNELLRIELPGIEVISFPYKYHKKILPYSLYSSWLIRKKAKYLRMAIKSCDYVMVHGETHFFAACVLKKIFKSQLCYAVRSDAVTENVFFINSSKGKWIKKLKYAASAFKYAVYERMIAAKADIIAFQSNFDYINFKRRTRVSPDKTCIIRGNIDEPWFKKEYEHINHSTHLGKVLYIGSIGDRKGIRYLLAAFHILHERNIEIKLGLVGKGPLEEEMKQLAVWLGLRDIVKFEGYSNTPFEFMKSHDLLVVPSVFDSYPDVLLEGLHAGIPVIASNVGGIPDILEDVRLLFPPADPEFLANLLEGLFNSAKLYSEYRDLCEKRLNKFHFDWPEAWELEMQKHLR
jgi:glycosyltransferase involved in cell wall biosynthesis